MPPLKHVSPAIGPVVGVDDRGGKTKERRMAEDKFEPRETNWRQLLPWIELFQGFRVALDLNKLLLAAAGILTMAFGWWLLAGIFDKPVQPDCPRGHKSNFPDATVACS